MSTPAEIYAAELQARATVKQLSAEAAALRKEAKTCELAVDAHGMRLQAKQLSLAAGAARALAKSHHIEAANALERCAAEMTHRMPPDYPSWGIMKTRGYVKLLEIVVNNAKLTNPKLAVATAAHSALLRYDAWTDDDAFYFGSLPKNPKSL